MIKFCLKKYFKADLSYHFSETIFEKIKWHACVNMI